MACAGCCCFEEELDASTEHRATDGIRDLQEPSILVDAQRDWQLDIPVDISLDQMHGSLGRALHDVSCTWHFESNCSYGDENKEEIPAPPPENNGNVFKAVLTKERDGEPLGIKIDSMDEKCLHICKVSSGGNTPVSRYNATAGTNQIMPGDYFLVVNGMSAASVTEGTKVSDSLRRQLSVLRTVEVMVSRPNEFEVKVDAQGENLGLDLTYSNYGVSLLIVQITDGAVGTRAPEVQKGDRILTVNGIEGSPPALFKALSGNMETLRLKVSRPFPYDPTRYGAGKSAVSFASAAEMCEIEA